MATFFWQNLGQEPNVEAYVSGAHITPIYCALVFHVQLHLTTQLLLPIDWEHYGLMLLGMAKSKCVANLVSLCKWMMANWIKPKMPSFPFAYQNMGKTGPISAIVHIQLFKIVQMDVPIQGTFGIWIVVLYSSFH
jgi:hypothetical protein